MRLEETRLQCQVPCLRNIGEGGAELPPQSLTRRIKLFIRRNMSPGKERSMKNFTDKQLNRIFRLLGRPTKPMVQAAGTASARVNTGDLVRVRSRGEIKATLNNWRQLKGCTFMPEMEKYCETIHHVHKRLEKFVDERDLRVKRSNGIILLDDVLCEGTAEFGRCDRSCFCFWREEWVEKIEE